MRYYTKILYWENARRIRELIKFRDQVVTYFNNCEFDRLEPLENEEAVKVRSAINRSMVEIRDMIIAAGVLPIITYTPPRTVGGYIQNIDMILNIFHVQHYDINPKEITDYLEKAIGVYEKSQRRSKIRIFNPFFYIGFLLDLIAEIPFFLVGKIGFNRTKAESSVIGRIIKGIGYLIPVLAAALTILDILGYTEIIKRLIGK